MAMDTARTDIAEHVADILMAAVFSCRHHGAGRPHWSGAAGLTEPTAAAAFDLEVLALLKASRPLRVALSRACQQGADGELDKAARAHFVELLEHELSTAPGHARRSIEALLGLNGDTHRRDGRARPVRLGGRGRPRVSNGEPDRPVGSGTASHSFRRVRVPVLLLNLIILVTMAFGPATHTVWGTSLPVGSTLELAVSAFAVWALSFIPGWLLVRFLERRAGALWDEYVIHLHRLGVDDPGNLPEPPKSSAYYPAWRDGGGLSKRAARNLYQEKFDAYYGRSVSRFGADEDRPVKSEALFPVFLCTAVISVGWTATLYRGEATLAGVSDGDVWSILPFAYLGAYLYFLQMLMRRYFQADLRAGAYVSGYVRIIGALIIAVVLQGTALEQAPGEVAVAVAFAVGWFPDVGLHWLLRVAARRLRGAVPAVEPAYPLNRLDGLNVWYETRLLEEGIEDLQNLSTAKLVDVVLHTRVPVARLVDWVDQALLLIHLPAEPALLDQKGLRPAEKARHAVAAGQAHRRRALRSCGIRSASSLIRALHPDRDDVQRERLFALLEVEGCPRAAVETLYAVIRADPRLVPVINWQEGDAKARTALGLGHA